MFEERQFSPEEIAELARFIQSRPGAHRDALLAKQRRVMRTPDYDALILRILTVKCAAYLAGRKSEGRARRVPAEEVNPKDIYVFENGDKAEIVLKNVSDSPSWGVVYSFGFEDGRIATHDFGDTVTIYQAEENRED